MTPSNRKPATKPLPEGITTVELDTRPDLPQSFGYKTAWWAIKSKKAALVASAVGLVNPLPCNWDSGISASRAGGVFVSPPVKGWVLVTGTNLLPKGKDVESSCLQPLLELSIQFGDAQVFATHRVVDYHVWARAKNGELTRGFAWVGESGSLLWDEGDDTTESGLGLYLPNTADLDADDLEDIDWPTEDHVLEIAAEWSISPGDLDEHRKIGVGLFGSDATLISKSV